MNLGRQGFSGEMSLAWLELGASDQGKWEFWGPGEVRPSRGGWGLPGVGIPRPHHPPGAISAEEGTVRSRVAVLVLACGSVV